MFKARSIKLVQGNSEYVTHFVNLLAIEYSLQVFHSDITSKSIKSMNFNSFFAYFLDKSNKGSLFFKLLIWNFVFKLDELRLDSDNRKLAFNMNLKNETFQDNLRVFVQARKLTS